MDLFNRIKEGDKLSLSKAITLLESNLIDDITIAQKLIADCLPLSGNSIRIGITGIPGVGKSTFIESFGKILTNKGNKIAVLAIDPTSERTQGSILGDKSRMNKLSIDKNAYIRASPTGGSLGGVNDKTRENIILCEAAGYNIILIETVGVGQNETSVNNLVDFFLLLTIAGAGDDLQIIKRGIIELADLILINKADGDNIKNTERTCIQYKNTLHLFPRNKDQLIVQVHTCSALKNIGIEKIIDIIIDHNKEMKQNGSFIKKRKAQKIYWLHNQIKKELGNKKYNSLIQNNKLRSLENKANNGILISQLIKDL